MCVLIMQSCVICTIDYHIGIVTSHHISSVECVPNGRCGEECDRCGEYVIVEGEGLHMLADGDVMGV